MGKVRDKSIDNMPVKILGKIKAETEKAILLETEDKWDKKIKIWLPKSQLKKPIEEDSKGIHTAILPLWLIEDKNISYVDLDPEEFEEISELHK